MKVVLLLDVKGTGKKGDVVEVSDGFARNFLLKNKKAVVADNTALNLNKQAKDAKNYHYEQDKQAAIALAEKLNNASVTLEVKGGENGKTFGSVTSKEIAEALNKQGLEIDKKQIVLKEPIKVAGEYQIEAKLFAGVSAKFKVIVKTI